MERELGTCTASVLMMSTVTTAAAMVTMVSSLPETRVVVSLPGGGVGVIFTVKTIVFTAVN